jgi:hypothetical protein
MNTIHFLNLFSDPVTLFFIMLLVQFLSILGQWIEAKKTGSTMTLMELLSYWPQLLLGLSMSISAFVALHESGMLNLASAMGIGGIVNKFTDILASRRAKAIVDSIPATVDHQARK